MKKPLIVANWKMSPSNLKDALDLAKSVALGVKDLNADIVLCPPFLYIPELFASGNVFLGAQNCFWEDEGAFTGEISPHMLKNIGCSYVILGHSERKKYLGETFVMVNKKILAALKIPIVSIVCIGEDMEKELPEVLKDVRKENMNQVVLVYEPEWAISTAENSRPENPNDAKRSIKEVRTILEKLFDASIAKTTTILYGGSAQSSDIQVFLTAGAQGALVGASSLNASEFIQLVRNAASLLS